MEQINIIPNDNIKLKRPCTEAQKRAQKKYNAKNIKQNSAIKLLLYHKKKDEPEYKARVKINNKNTYQRRKERKIKNEEEKIILLPIIDVI